MTAIQLSQLDDVVCSNMLSGDSCQNHSAVCLLGLITSACDYFFHPFEHIFSHWMMMILRGVEVVVIEKMLISLIRSVRFVYWWMAGLVEEQLRMAMAMATARATAM